MHNDNKIEKMIQEKELNAPRITPDNVNDSVVSDQYYVFPGTQTTICLLTLTNGFTVTGESACASPKNFDEEVGRTIALENAKDKIWVLLGFALKEKLYLEGLK